MTREASDAMFDQVRLLVFRVFPDTEADFADQPDLVPIEGSWAGDGAYICLHRSGEVGLLAAAGRFDPSGTFGVSKTALIGSLARRVALASWFVPKCTNPEVCSFCQGTGKTGNDQLANVVCNCGGLGWIAR